MMEKPNLSTDEIQEISNLTNTLTNIETELIPIDIDEISSLMQTSDDDVLVEGRITEFHDIDQVLDKKISGSNKTPSLAKYKQNRKNKQKQVNKSRKQNR